MELLGLIDISPTWIIVAGLLLLFYVYGKKRNGFFKDIGLSGPEPIIYIGNFHQIIMRGVHFDNPDRKKYGDVFGVFLGGYPLISVYDPEIIREVLIKNFQNFTDRMLIDLDDYPINKGLFFEKGAAWRRVRHISSPTFSGAKLRMMCERITKCASALTDNLVAAAESKTDILVKDYFGGYTMDVIASTAFGIESDSQTEMDSQLMVEAKKVFAGAGVTNPLTMLVLMFPSLNPLFKALGVASFPKKSIRFFKDVITKMIEERKAETGTGAKHVDFLQLLLDAEDDGTLGDVTNPDQTGQKESKKMTQDEILGQALLFFVAGYETTANTLHYIAYSLATNPDVQDRLIDEIDSVLGDREPDYDNIGELAYMENVITETLRMYPVVPMLNRETAETVKIKGYTFPKGSAVSIMTVLIHRDPDIYPDPQRFDPDRWERKSEMEPMNYLPFGHGPRHCIGMRLAQVEMRIALAHVLKKVRFLPADDTPAVLEGKDLKITGTLSTKKPIKLRVEKR